MPHLLKILRYFLNGKAQRIFCLQIFIAFALYFGGRFLWNALKNEISAQDAYRIELKDIRVFDPPKWVSNDLIRESLEYRPKDVRNDEMNSLDPDLPQRLFTAFSQHPWVKSVEKISVYYPGKIDVRLRFKTPIAVVDPTQPVAGDFDDGRRDAEFLPATNANPASAASFNGSSRDGTQSDSTKTDGKLDDSGDDETATSRAEKYVVDENGYRLPDDYFKKNPNEYYEFLWILGIYSTPITKHGSFADPFVADAAQFAEFLVQNDVPNKLGINRIVVSRKRGAVKATYRLKTKGETTVVWGRFAPPKALRSEETTPEIEFDEVRPDPAKIKEKTFEYQKQKLSRLFEIAETYRSLDETPKENVDELDLSHFLTDEDENF